MAGPDTALDRASLKDLDGVRVVVEELPATLAAKGITQEKVRKWVEAQLASQKIVVLNPGEFPVGDPFLRVHIATTAPQKALVGYRVDVDFAQIVFLRRNPMITFNRAQTWAAMPAMGLTSPAKLVENVNLALAEQTAQFIAAYLSVNPGGHTIPK